MGDEVKKEGTEQPPNTSETVDWKAMYEAAMTDVARLQKSVKAVEAKVSKYEGTVRKQVESRVFADIIDPDLAKLAPPIELDSDGEITASSAEAINKWKSEKAHFFKEPEPSGDKPESKKEEPKGLAKVQVPPTGSTGKRSVEWFDNLRKTNPTEWRKPEVQRAYIRAVDEATKTNK